MGFVAKVKTGSDQSIAYNPVGSSLYGVCGVPGNNADKTVDVGLDYLMNGITIHVKFTNANTVANPTLNVNGLGQLPIYTHQTVRPGNTPVTSWDAGSVVSFTYDGAQGSECWRMNDSGANAAIVDLAHQEVTTETNNRAAADTMVLSRIAPDYDASATYHINDLRMNGQQLYRCLVEITEPEAWTPAHWTPTTVATERTYELRFNNVEVGIASTATAEVSGTGVTAATVNVATFQIAFPNTGDYTFTYVNTGWTYNLQPVEIENYGIAVTGTPANGDQVIIHYTKGQKEFMPSQLYPAYPFMAEVPLEGVRESMIADVIFALQDAISGMYAPIVESYGGGIHLFATNVPPQSIVIPTIVCKEVH